MPDTLFSPFVEVANTPLPVDGSGVTQPVSGTVTVNAGTGTFQVAGSVSTTPLSSNTDTVTQLTSTGSNQVALVSNAARKAAIFFFSSGNWSLKYGVGASATSFTYNITTANTAIIVSIWTGEIDVICTTAGKLLNITELM